MRTIRLTVLAATLLTLAAQRASSQVTPADTANSREKNMIISLKSDLRNLVVAQEQYFADHSQYAAVLTDTRFRASTGNSVKFLVAEKNGWSAEARNATLPAVCIIFVNLTPDKQPKTAKNKITGAEGEPVCDLDP